MYMAHVLIQCIYETVVRIDLAFSDSLVLHAVCKLCI